MSGILKNCRQQFYPHINNFEQGRIIYIKLGQLHRKCDIAVHSLPWLPYNTGTAFIVVQEQALLIGYMARCQRLSLGINFNIKMAAAREIGGKRASRTYGIAACRCFLPTSLKEGFQFTDPKITKCTLYKYQYWLYIDRRSQKRVSLFRQFHYLSSDLLNLYKYYTKLKLKFISKKKQ